MRLNLRHKIASFFVSRALREITAWAQAVAHGDFSRKISISVREDIGGLADSLDLMSQQIQSRMEEFIADKSRLEAVFLSMFDGVMILDQKGTIILMNRTLREFLSVAEETSGRRPLEVIRHIEIQEMAENMLALKKRFEAREITVLLPEEKILLVHATPVLRQGRVEGAVLVFHDITGLRRLEKIRQDFVANVSHELRTPVSTIRGYAETLLEGALEDKKHAREFLQIIYEDSDRLARLIKDLLDLSRLESGKAPVNPPRCSLAAVIERSLKAVERQAAAGSIRLSREIPADLPQVRMDEAAIGQVLLNLLENAVRYNRPGGSVSVTAGVKGNSIETAVADTGIGIPQEDLPRIFERFYRVDKARSRELGGTGLGLSIVKHIIHAHQGEVTVESELGKGSTFRFTLPLGVVKSL